MIKWLAMLLMILDHIASFAGGPLIFRIVGRLVFPIFCYQSVLGYRRTHSLPRYFCRLLIFALVTQIALYIMSEATGLYLIVNVIFTFCFGILMCLGYDAIKQGLLSRRKKFAEPTAQAQITIGHLAINPKDSIYLGLSFLLAAGGLTWLIQPDYSYFGVVMFLLFHILDDSGIRFEQKGKDGRPVLIFCLSMAALNIIWYFFREAFTNTTQENLVIQPISILACLLFPFLARGKKQGKFGQYFFYFFYPLHICLIMLITYFLSA